MTKNDAGTRWRRAKPYLKAGEMMVDRIPGAEVLSSRPIGLGQARLKWEIPDKMLVASPWLDRLAKRGRA